MKKYILILTAMISLVACNSEKMLRTRSEKLLNSMYEALRDNDPKSFFSTEIKYYTWVNSLSQDKQKMLTDIETEWMNTGRIGGYFQGMKMFDKAENDASMIRFVCDFVPEESSKAIQKLEDIQKLQQAYKNTYGNYADNFETLRHFYINESIIDYYIVDETEARVPVYVPVKDKLFTDRKDFDISTIEYVPNNRNDVIQMRAYTQRILGLQIPLFEASIPWRLLLSEYDDETVQSIIRVMNKAECYPGLMVGNFKNTISGNWEH